MPIPSTSERSLVKSITCRADVAERCFATIVGGILVAGIHLNGLAAFIWSIDRSSNASPMLIRGLAFAFGIVNVMALPGNAIMFKWMWFWRDEANEPLPFQVIPCLRAESPWIRRTIPLACCLNLMVLSLAMCFFEMLFTREVGGAAGAVGVICFQIAICFVSNSFIVFFLEWAGARESVQRKFWARRFLFDVCVSFVVWGGMQLLPDYGVNVRT